MTKRAGPRYAIIPADAITDSRISGIDLKVLALLGRHIDKKGWCVRTQGRMATELGIARGTLQRALGRISECGYVEISHEKRRDGGQAANRYRVVLDDETRAAQLDLFGQQSDDAVRSSAGRPAKAQLDRDAPPASPAMHPLPRLSEAPPASPERGTQEERPLQQTSPSDSRAELRERDVGRPATVDLHQRDDLDRLKHRLREAAGSAINEAHPAFIVLAEPLGWLVAGCDLEADVLPTIAGLAARHRGAPIRSWRYFAEAVIEARDRRLRATSPPSPLACQAPAETATIIPFDSRGTRYGPDHAADPPQPSGRFAAHAARRRRDLAGDGAGGADDPG